MEWWADLATVAAAVLAAVGLLATAWSVRGQARSNDLNALFLIANQLREAEARLLNCATDHERRNEEVVNYLNLLETIATALNSGLFRKATSKIAKDRLANDIAILLANEETRTRIETAITSEDTFRELGRFERNNRQKIRRLLNINSLIPQKSTKN